MKNVLTILFIFTISLMFTSCSNDDMDESINSLEASVWKLESIVLETPININNNGIPTTVLFEAPGYLGNSELVFNSSSNGTIFFSADVFYNTRIENGELFYLITSSTSTDRIPSAITYNLNNDSGVINNTGIESNFTIIESELYLVIENGFIAKDIDTNEISVYQDLTYIFIKQ